MRGNKYALFIGVKIQTYIFDGFGNILRKGSGRKVLSWQSVDNCECSQTRDNGEEREAHCNRVVDKKAEDELERLAEAVDRLYLYLSAEYSVHNIPDTVSFGREFKIVHFCVYIDLYI